MSYSTEIYPWCPAVLQSDGINAKIGEAERPTWNQQFVSVIVSCFMLLRPVLVFILKVLNFIESLTNSVWRNKSVYRKKKNLLLSFHATAGACFLSSGRRKKGCQCRISGEFWWLTAAPTFQICFFLTVSEAD